MPEWMLYARRGRTARVYDGRVMADEHPATHFAPASEVRREQPHIQIMSLTFQIVSCCHHTTCGVRPQSPGPVAVDATPSDEWWETERAAKYLNLTAKTVREGAAKKTLPGHKYPANSNRGRWLFKKDELDRFLQRPATHRKPVEISVWN